MKKIFLTIFAILALIFSSCSNKVELYADEGAHTIVYALLDPDADTNFFKITKSFIGNVQELSQNYDANNYQFDEIEVRLTGVFDSENTATQTLTLDTISRWIPEDNTQSFYNGCYQTYYYTAEKLLPDNEYLIEVYRKADGVTSSARVKMINTFRITQVSLSPISQYTPPTIDLLKSSDRIRVMWKSTPLVSSAAYFEVYGIFEYFERQPGSSTITTQYIEWKIAANEAEKLYNSTDMVYFAKYKPSTFLRLFENNKHLVENSQPGVSRGFGKFTIKVMAFGDELYRYHIINNASSAIQEVPNYTNVENGYGIVSSYIMKAVECDLEIQSQRYIIETYPQFGFSESF